MTYLKVINAEEEEEQGKVWGLLCEMKGSGKESLRCSLSTHVPGRGNSHSKGLEVVSLWRSPLTNGTPCPSVPFSLILAFSW